MVKRNKNLVSIELTRLLAVVLKTTPQIKNGKGTTVLSCGVFAVSMQSFYYHVYALSIENCKNFYKIFIIYLQAWIILPI